LVNSVRGSGSLPTTAASAASGCTGLLRAFWGVAAFFGVGIGQLERSGLGCQAKNQPCFSGSRERHGESQPIVLGPFIRELNSFGNTHDPTNQVFLNLGLKDRSKYLREGGRAKHAPSKLIRVLNYVWLLVVFPVAVAILVGVFGYSANLG